MAASERNATACVEWMLDSGADCNAKNEDGSTAFHYACAFGSLHCIAALVKHNCDCTAMDVRCYPPFPFLAGTSAHCLCAWPLRIACGPLTLPPPQPPQDEGNTGAKLAEAEPWRDILSMILNLALSQQWKELEVLIGAPPAAAACMHAAADCCIVFIVLQFKFAAFWCA